MVPRSSDALSSTFSALSDPTRRDILARLATGDASVGELAQPFAMSLPAVSKHLSVLEEAGLIVREKEGRIRRCRLEPGPLREAMRWLDQYRPFRPGQEAVSPVQSYQDLTGPTSTWTKPDRG